MNDTPHGRTPTGAALDPGPLVGYTEDRIRDVVHTFYGRVRDDPVLGPVFADRLVGRWPDHLDRMCDFWSSVLMGSRSFRGDPMGAHVGLPGIEPAHFDRWMTLFHRTVLDRLPGHLAADMNGRAARMRVALERAACPGSHTRPPQPPSLRPPPVPHPHTPGDHE